jgi:ADP-ribose pyrophosphatase
MHRVRLPSGEVIEDWPWVVTPDFVTIVAVTASGDFMCFRQPKYAVEGSSLAAIGGYLDAGEAPLTAAKRELLEETGCEAGQWTCLGSFAVDGNRGAGTAHLYLARDVRTVTAPDADDVEPQQLVTLTRDGLESALTRGEFRVMPWALAAALALRLT